MPTEISGSTGVNKIQDGTIVNADINSSAAIAGSKLVMPSGSVLQVKSDDWSSESSSTSNTYNDTGLSVSITPSSSSNKILVIATLCSWAMSNSASYWQAQLQRGNTTIQEFQKVGGYSTSGNHATSDSTATIFLDSPNTTSATTYKIQSRPVDSGHLLVMNWNGAISTIIAMEIAG